MKQFRNRSLPWTALAALALFAAPALAQQPAVPEPAASQDPAAPEKQEPKPAPVGDPPVPVSGDPPVSTDLPKPQDPAPVDPGAKPPVPADAGAKPGEVPTANPATPTPLPETAPVPAQPAPAPAPAPATTTPAAVVAALGAPATTGQTAAVLPALSNLRDLVSVQAALDKIASEHASLVRTLDLGTTTDGRKVPALLFGAEGPLALEVRPCVLLLGALDGESPTGGLAVLQVSAELLSEPASLPGGVSFAAVPWASPEALELSLQGRSADGRNTRPVDEDRDGRIDEDGPDDLDGDGAILQMLVEDPDGPWVRPANQR
ncbi:MAG: hypothetical protein ABIP42_13245, partial [Planctomycetota bacterium]